MKAKRVVFSEKIGILLTLLIVALFMNLTAFGYESMDGSVNEDKLPTMPAEVEVVKEQPVAANGTASNVSLSNKHYHYFGNQLKTPQEKQLYNRLEEELLKGKNQSSVVVFETPLALSKGTNPSSDQQVQLEVVTRLKRALDAFKFDHPQLSWITGNSTLLDISIRVYENGEVYVHSASAYYEPLPVSSNERQQITNIVAQIAGEAAKETGDYKKIKKAHDMLAKQITYGNVSQPKSYHLTGGLVYGVGTCEAYSKAFKMVMDKMGYECILVGGCGYNAGEKIPHMWNYVKVGGSWYGVDVTWNDQKIILHDYFLAGRNTVAPNFKNRTFGNDHVEEYTFSYLNYENFYYPKISSQGYNG